MGWDITRRAKLGRRAVTRLVASCGLLLPWALRSARAAEPVVDAALVGLWELSGVNQYGPWKLVWDVRADGSYDIAGSISDHGIISARSGTWIMTSTVSSMRTVGTYKLHETRYLDVSGPLGLGRWHRLGEAKAAPTPDHRS